MITISTLQSQIALNRRNLAFLENSVREVVNDIKDLKCRISECKDEHKEQYAKNMQSVFDYNYKDLARGKKWIKKYAKLQRALKDELAYRIRYSRVMREVEASTEKAKIEGWEVVIMEDNKYDKMLKGD